MSRNLRTAAGVGLMSLAIACAPNSGGRVQTPSVPSRGAAMSEDMQTRCVEVVSDLVSRLTKDPSAKGIEVGVPSDEYLSCLRLGLEGSSLAEKTGKSYMLVPTENPRMYTVVGY